MQNGTITFFGMLQDYIIHDSITAKLNKMRMVIIIIFLLFSASFKCEKAGENCHYEITFYNTSETTVRWGIISNGISGCRFEGEKLESNKIAKYRPFNICIEEMMSESDHINFYVIDTSKINPPDLYYSCDSIEHYNKVLKRYSLNLQDLKDNNFSIYYP